MAELKMSVPDIKKLISLREEYWENDLTTNCYAFALGLDVAENDIIKNAYQLGIIGSTIFNIPYKILKDLTIEERLILDMRALDIECKKTSPTAKTEFKITKSSVEISWIIALFSNEKGYHFARKSYDGEWYHKVGCVGRPIIMCDNNREAITNIESFSILGYQYLNSYMLRKKEKNIKLF